LRIIAEALIAERIGPDLLACRTSSDALTALRVDYRQIGNRTQPLRRLRGNVRWNPLYPLQVQSRFVPRSGDFPEV